MYWHNNTWFINFSQWLNYAACFLWPCWRHAIWVWKWEEKIIILNFLRRTCELHRGFWWPMVVCFFLGHNYAHQGHIFPRWPIFRVQHCHWGSSRVKHVVSNPKNTQWAAVVGQNVQQQKTTLGDPPVSMGFTWDQLNWTIEDWKTILDMMSLDLCSICSWLTQDLEHMDPAHDGSTL